MVTKSKDVMKFLEERILGTWHSKNRWRIFLFRMTSCKRDSTANIKGAQNLVSKKDGRLTVIMEKVYTYIDLFKGQLLLILQPNNDIVRKFARTEKPSMMG